MKCMLTLTYLQNKVEWTELVIVCLAVCMTDNLINVVTGKG